MSREEEIGQRVFQQALDLWIIPEIKRRREQGLIPQEFSLRAAQVIFPSPFDSGRNYVRLNEEVKALAKAKLNRAIPQGDIVYQADIDGIEILRLADNDEPNSGHLTMLRIKDHWTVAFDFTRDRSRAEALLERAREFCKSAKLCFGRNLLGPGIDNLFSAAELAAKAELLLSTFYSYSTRKGHGSIRGRYACWAKLGNAPSDGNTALNKLSRLRPAARYLEGDLCVVSHHELLRAVNRMIKHVEKRLLVKRRS